MKKTNHFYRFCALALSCLLLISLLPVTQVLADGDDAIHIKSAEDLRSLAHSCTLDSWSRGKTVVLDNDIELTDDDELPIPTFGGTFNGNGHTISGLSITQSVPPAGLFGVLQKDAVIKKLNVEGTVTPSGDSENIGGIVGENHGTIDLRPLRLSDRLLRFRLLLVLGPLPVLLDQGPHGEPQRHHKQHHKQHRKDDY